MGCERLVHTCPPSLHPGSLKPGEPQDEPSVSSPEERPFLAQVPGPEARLHVGASEGSWERGVLATHTGQAPVCALWHLCCLPHSPPSAGTPRENRGPPPGASGVRCPEAPRVVQAGFLAVSNHPLNRKG